MPDMPDQKSTPYLASLLPEDLSSLEEELKQLETDQKECQDLIKIEKKIERYNTEIQRNLLFTVSFCDFPDNKKQGYKKTVFTEQKDTSGLPLFEQEHKRKLDTAYMTIRSKLTAAEGNQLNEPGAKALEDAIRREYQDALQDLEAKETAIEAGITTAKVEITNLENKKSKNFAHLADLVRKKAGLVALKVDLGLLKRVQTPKYTVVKNKTTLILAYLLTILADANNNTVPLDVALSALEEPSNTYTTALNKEIKTLNEKRSKLLSDFETCRAEFDQRDEARKEKLKSLYYKRQSANPFDTLATYSMTTEAHLSEITVRIDSLTAHKETLEQEAQEKEALQLQLREAAQQDAKEALAAAREQQQKDEKAPDDALKPELKENAKLAQVWNSNFSQEKKALAGIIKNDDIIALNDLSPALKKHLNTIMYLTDAMSIASLIFHLLKKENLKPYLKEVILKEHNYCEKHLNWLYKANNSDGSSTLQGKHPQLTGHLKMMAAEQQTVLYIAILKGPAKVTEFCNENAFSLWQKVVMFFTFGLISYQQEHAKHVAKTLQANPGLYDHSTVAAEAIAPGSALLV